MNRQPWLGLGPVIVLLAGMAMGADVDDQDALVSRSRDFQIPLAINPDTRDQLGQITLFVTSDQGKTWKVAGQITPEQNHFRFKAPGDGLYWFDVRATRRGETREVGTHSLALKV